MKADGSAAVASQPRADAAGGAVRSSARKLGSQYSAHVERVRDELRRSAGPVNVAMIAEAVRASGLALGAGTTAQLVKSLRDELMGLGPFQPFVEEDGVTDVLLDPLGWMWTDGAEGLRRRDVQVDEHQARGLARRLIAMAGGRLDEGQPCADGRIDRYRIHAVLPPVSGGGPLVSIRVAGESSADLRQLARQWEDASLWLGVIRAMVHGRANYLISGATGSGKTSLLSAMLADCAPGERILVVEDTTEVRPSHPHIVHLQARAGNVEGAGRIDIGQLVRETLRMRPDRLIVGECRGAELRDFLTAMNTGHQGAGGTVHANSPAAVPARLVAMGALAGLDPQAVSLQAAAALDAVIHVERRNGRRMPVALSLLSYEQGGLTLKTVLENDGSGLRRGVAYPAFCTAFPIAGIGEVRVLSNGTRGPQGGHPAACGENPPHLEGERL